MPTRVENKVTGTERDLPDRLAQMLIADPSSGWRLPSKRKTRTTKSDTDETREND